MSNQNDMKYLKKICRGLLLCSTGIVLATTYNAYHTIKESNKLSLAQELGDEGSLTFSFYLDASDNPVLSILSSDSNYILSDDDYEKFNQLLHNEIYPISKLDLTGLGGEVDFSKVDLSGITDVSFQNVQDNFDYSPFSNYNFDSISFFYSPMNDSLQTFLKSTELDYSTVSVSNGDFDIIAYLEEAGKVPNKLDIRIYGGFYEETLPEVSARKVNMHYYFDHHQLLDVDVSLSDKVEEANFSFAILSDNSQDIFIDDVSIDSNNSDLELSFVNDDEDRLTMEFSSISSASLPDGSYVTFENIDCSDSSLFTSFDNLSGFSYSDGKGKELSYVNKNSSNPKVKSLNYY